MNPKELKCNTCGAYANNHDSCSICGQSVCTNCSIFCEVCNNTVCENHYDESKHMCLNCASKEAN